MHRYFKLEQRSDISKILKEKPGFSPEENIFFEQANDPKHMEKLASEKPRKEQAEVDRKTAAIEESFFDQGEETITAQSNVEQTGSLPDDIDPEFAVNFYEGRLDVLNAAIEQWQKIDTALAAEKVRELAQSRDELESFLEGARIALQKEKEDAQIEGAEATQIEAARDAIDRAAA